jgi:hypothetical protein
MLLSITCTSTKSTLQNTDDNAPDLLLSANNTFVIQYSCKSMGTTKIILLIFF